MVVKYGKKKGYVRIAECAAQRHGKNPHCLCAVLPRRKPERRPKKAA